MALEAVEEHRQHAMLDLFATFVGHEACLCRVRHHGGAVDEHVVPRLVAIGLRAVPGVPLLAGPAHGIEVDDNSAIAIPAVPDEIAGPKERLAAGLAMRDPALGIAAFRLLAGLDLFHQRGDPLARRRRLKALEFLREFVAELAQLGQDSPDDKRRVIVHQGQEVRELCRIGSGHSLILAATRDQHESIQESDGRIGHATVHGSPGIIPDMEIQLLSPRSGSEKNRIESGFARPLGSRHVPSTPNVRCLLFLVLVASSCGGGGGGGSSPPTAISASLDTAKNLASPVVLTGKAAKQGASLSYAVLTNPSHGTLSGSAPNLTYTPNSGYVGEDHFDFRALVAGTPSASATMRIFVTDYKEISPSGGLVATATFHPSNPNELWASADDGGGLYKSSNAGTTWALQQGPPLNWSSYTLTFDPSNAAILYAPNHFGRGLIKTTDGGATWSQVGNGLPTSGTSQKKIHDLAVHPTNGGQVWVATGSGLFRSTNGGGDFSKISSTAFGSETDFRAVELSSAGRVFVGTVHGGVYDSTDGGTTWTVIGTPVGTSPVLSDLALTANAVYVGFFSGWIRRATGFVAANYTVINNPTTGGIRSFVWTKLEAVSGASVAQDQLYVGTTWVASSTQWGFHYSADGGSSYTKRTTGLNGASAFDIVLDPTNSSRLLFCSVNDGVFLSNNAGTSWTEVSSGVHATDSLAIAEDPNDANHLVFTSGAAFPGTSKTLETTNGGATWTEIGSLSNIDVLDLEFAPGSSTNLLATTHNAGIYRSTTGTAGPWSKVLTRTKQLKWLKFSKADSNRVYAVSENPVTGTEAGIYSSSDAGATWVQRWTNDVPQNVAALQMTPHPTTAAEVVVLGTDVWVSTDALATGRAGAKSLGLAAFAPGKFFSSGTFRPSDPSTLLVGTTTGELYRTKNYSATGNVTWERIQTPGKNALVHDIHIIEGSQGTTWLLALWIGDTSFQSTSTTGILRSDDGGATWAFLDRGLYPCSLTWHLRQRTTNPRSFLVGFWGAAGFYTLDI